MVTKETEETRDEELEKKPLLPLPSVKKWWSGKSTGWVFLVLTIIISYIGTAISQFTTIEMNMYQLFASKYATQCAILAIIVIYNKASMKIESKDIKYFLLLLCLETFQSPLSATAATFMTGGNFEAVFNAIFIISAGIYDFLIKEITHLRFSCCLAIAAGTIFIAQPWIVDTNDNISNIDNSTRHLNSTLILANNSFHIPNANLTKLNASTSSQTHPHNPAIYQTIFGYSLLIISALAFTLKNNLAKYLYKKYDVSTVVFWLCLANTFIALLISVVWKLIMNEAFFDFKFGIFSLSFTCLYIVMTALGSTLCYYSVKYSTVSKLAVALVYATLLLYISLKVFHPGNTNAVEVIGLIIAIFGIMILPAIEQILEKAVKIITGFVHYFQFY